MLQSPFEVALQDYEEQTGIDLIDHPLVTQLEKSDSVKTVTALLQEQAKLIRKVRGDDSELMESLKRVVNILHLLSTAAAFGEGNDLVRRKVQSPLDYVCFMTSTPQLSLPTKSIFAAFAILIRVGPSPSSRISL
jgi:hypothetical protein